ncbi:MAG: hypothetical protein HY906_04090 [Deltaproteobacteria bacterium]|nr:hypothetical protein [Deltaproteobacteria bacterium]
MMPTTFREACCERFGVGPEAFEDAVLRHCLYPHARPVARLLRRRARRGYFDPDLDLIRAVAECTGLSAMAATLNVHRYHHADAGFWRGLLRVRLSGRRLMDLGAELLP